MNRLLVPIVVLLTMCQPTAVEAQLPRLLVLLTVEELQSDLLEELRPHLSAEGLSVLLDKGTVYPNTCNPLLHPNRTSSAAMIQTGTLPLYNGVVGSKPYQRTKEGRVVGHKSAFTDDAFIGFSTTDRRSPRALTAPTIGDQLKEASGGSAIVASLAPNSEEALIGGGHSADFVLWLDDYNAKWVSSTYYKNSYPWYVAKSNDQATSPAQSYSTQKWTPLHPATSPKYNTLPYINMPNGGFTHSFSKGATGIAQYKTSGLVNEAVANMACQLIQQSNIGADATPDLLNIHLYAGNYIEDSQTLTPQLVDTYYRLDKAIGQILKCVQRKVGPKGAVVALVGTAHAKTYYNSGNPLGNFYLNRCKALLNMYLMAKYGQQNWVQEITEDGQIYLDRQLIKKAGIALNNIQDDVANFMLEFSGITTAVADYKLRERAFDAELSASYLSCLSKNTHTHRGDVLFDIHPGWRIGPDETKTTSPSLQYTQQAVTSPFIVWHPTASKGESIPSPQSILSIAPHLCHILRIRPPTPVTTHP